MITCTDHLKILRIKHKRAVRELMEDIEALLEENHMINNENDRLRKILEIRDSLMFMGLVKI